jgi:hypothetical protein
MTEASSSVSGGRERRLRFVDEADALVGCRVEFYERHDRYANFGIAACPSPRTTSRSLSVGSFSSR